MTVLLTSSPPRLTLALHSPLSSTAARSYMAPEVFRHEKYSDKVDIYSVGMIAFQVRVCDTRAHKGVNVGLAGRDCAGVAPSHTLSPT